MFASTGPKEDPILTPSFCSYNLLLKVSAVFVQVSNISSFKVVFLRFVEISLSSYIRFNMILIVLLIGTFVKSDSTSKEINLWFDSKRSFGMLFILVAASNEPFTENSFTVNGLNKLAKNFSHKIMSTTSSVYYWPKFWYPIK